MPPSPIPILGAFVFRLTAVPIWLGSRLDVDGPRASERPGDDWETAESRSQDVAEVDLIGSVEYKEGLPRLEDE